MDGGALCLYGVLVLGRSGSGMDHGQKSPRMLLARTTKAALEGESI